MGQKKTILELERVELDEYRRLEKIPLAVVLDDVRSEMNVGSIFRTADAFLVEEIVLCGITATPPKPEIHKTALGAEDSVSWRYEKDVSQAVDGLRERGYTVLAIEQVHGSVSLDAFVPERDGRYAVVLGNEVKGVSQQAVDLSDRCIEIPQYGTKHSLNVSVTAGIVIYRLSTALRMPR